VIDHGEIWRNDWLRLSIAGPVLVAGARHYPGRPSMRDRYPGRRIVGADMQEGDGVHRVCDLEQPQPELVGRFAHVDCCSVLEHSRAPWRMAETLTAALRPGGTMFVTAPFVWRVHGYPSDYWRFTIDGIRELFPLIEWRKMDYVSDQITASRVPATDVEKHPYLARTEVFAFGALKG